MLKNNFMLKWIQTLTLKCKDVDYDVNSDVDDEIGIGNDE